MATKIRSRTNPKKVVRFKRKRRIRSRVSGSTEQPRMAVFRSNQHLAIQLIDDVKGHTLVSATTAESEFKGKLGKSVEGAKVLGALIAKRALAKNIQNVVFDRAGYLYHGRIKAVADAARESGLKF